MSSSGAGDGLPSSLRVLLDGVRVVYFRSFRLFPGERGFLGLGGFTSIVGRNDVGKSNLIQAIRLFYGDYRPSVDDFHNFEVDNPIRVVLRFKVIGDRGICSGLEGSLKVSMASGLTGVTGFTLGSECPVVRRGGSDGSVGSGGLVTRRFLIGDVDSFEEANMSASVFNRILEFLPKPIYVPAFTSPEDEFSLKKTSILSQLISPLIEKSTLSIGGRKERLSEVLKMQVRSQVSQISSELSRYARGVWSDIDGVEIEVADVSLTKALSIDVRVRDRFTGRSISLFNRGSGLQREFIVELMRVYRDRMIGKGYVFIVEEPEIHLHAGAQRRFMSILKGISREGQVIITTHSSIFIDRADYSALHLLRRENGETTAVLDRGDREILREALDELGVMPSDILHSNGIIIVEGISDKYILEALAASIYENWDEYDVSMIPLGGSSNIVHVKDYFDTLFKVNRNIAIIMDADIDESGELKPEKEDFKRVMEERGIPVYFWKDENGRYIREIENLFDAEVIRRYIEGILDKKGGDELVDECKEKLGGIEVKPTTRVIEIIGRLARECKISIPKEKHEVGRQLARIAVETGKIPSIVKEILDDILQRFGLTDMAD